MGFEKTNPLLEGDLTIRHFFLCYNDFVRYINYKRDQNVKDLYNSGSSGPSIATKLRLSLNQVYDSLKRQKIPRRSTVEQNKITFQNSPLSFEFRQPRSIRDKELLIAGIMLYYGEGAKTGTTVDFANSDLSALKVFLGFLRRICKVDENRLRFYLYCFSDQSPRELISYWSRQLKVSIEKFTKPYIRQTKNSKLTRVMPRGVLHIRYSDKRLLEKIKLLSDLLFKNLGV